MYVSLLVFTVDVHIYIERNLQKYSLPLIRYHG